MNGSTHPTTKNITKWVKLQEYQVVSYEPLCLIVFFSITHSDYNILKESTLHTVTRVLRNALGLHENLQQPLRQGCSAYTRKDAQRFLLDSINAGLDGSDAFCVLGGLVEIVGIIDDPFFCHRCYVDLIIWCVSLVGSGDIKEGAMAVCSGMAARFDREDRMRIERRKG